ncbi:MAG: FHA domain-containing protein, partial [Pyrinomonadaceae bacterium]|nr:FHA domain-containing protein [Pyrinomonadaceae bacterium]
YFTEGVQLLGSFGKFADEGEDEAEVNVTLPNIRDEVPALTSNATVVDLERLDERFRAIFTTGGKDFDLELDFAESKRMSVGRTKEQDLTIPDQSVSKIHASLVFNEERGLLLADTGSTNGTFINEERIKYGKAFEIGDRADVKFGNVNVSFERMGKPAETELFQDVDVDPHIMPTEAAFNFVSDQNSGPAPTEAVEKDLQNLVSETSPQSSNEPADWEMTNNEVNFSEDEIDSTLAELKPEAAPTEAYVKRASDESSIPVLEPLASRVIESSSVEKDEIDQAIDEAESQTGEDYPDDSEEIQIDKTQDWEI